MCACASIPDTVSLTSNWNCLRCSNPRPKRWQTSTVRAATRCPAWAETRPPSTRNAAIGCHKTLRERHLDDLVLIHKNVIAVHVLNSSWEKDQGPLMARSKNRNFVPSSCVTLRHVKSIHQIAVFVIFCQNLAWSVISCFECMSQLTTYRLPHLIRHSLKFWKPKFQIRPTPSFQALLGLGQSYTDHFLAVWLKVMYLPVVASHLGSHVQVRVLYMKTPFRILWL